MKFVFGFILLLHALVHLMGFAKAFQLANINQLTQSIPKPIGMLWLFTALLFVVTLILFLLKKEWWFIIAIVAVIVSQILIILYWQDAKFATIANVIILMVSISAYGNYQFNKMVQTESKQILQNIQVENLPKISKEDINHLPEIVQKWLQNSGVVGKERIVSVRLKQKGEIKTKPKGKWMPFTATQYFNVENPAFIWTTKVDAMPIIKMVGRDKLYNGKGEMLIKLASLIPVANEGNNEKIKASTMVRYMAEMVWFPSTALNDYIKWEPIDANSVQATFILNEKSVLGIFKFSDNGDFKSFEAERHFGTGKDATLETWLVKAKTYKNFNDFKIPNKCSVTWKLKEGDFNWLNLEIIDLEFNSLKAYNK